MILKGGRNTLALLRSPIGYFFTLNHFFKLKISIMKNLKFQLSSLLILALFFTVSCTDDDDADPDGISTELLVKTWTVNENSITIGGVPISNLYDLADVPEEDRPDWSQFRLIFNADGTYEVQSVDLAGIQSSGTWQISGANNNELTINPGDVTMEISNLSSSKFDVDYTINTAGTDFESLGTTAVVSAEMQAVNQ